MKKTINIKGKILDLSSPKIMGILNLTDDSFFAKSRANSREEIISKVNQLILDGADIIDIGAYSTRPGASDVSESQEKVLILEAVNLIKSSFKECILSIDTFRSSVAESAIIAGADIINDVSGGNLDPNMFEIVAKYNVPYVLMHMRGNPQTMASLNDYENVVIDVLKELKIKIQKLRDLGHFEVIVDPGFGFAKNLDQNYELLANLEMFKILRIPLLVGASRKSMIYNFLNIEADNSLNGTVVLNFYALENGANILRVHDVLAAKQTVKLFEKLIHLKNHLP